MKIFNNYSIKLRLAVSVTLGLIGMLLIASQSLIQTNEMLLSEKKQQVQHLVETVHSIVGSSYQQFKMGNITEEEAQQRAIDAINAMRYDGNNYFWINDENATMVAHPIKPALNGKNLSSVQDPNGKYLFQAFAQRAQENPDGNIVDYQWPKPGSEMPIDKISFVKEFAPWNWIIGSGIYIDDIEESMWESVYSLLINLFVIMTLILILSCIISRSIIDPINKTTDALADLAKGEGNLTQRLPISGKDEIAKLSQSFNEFIAKIQHIIKEVQDSSKAVKISSNDLSTLSHKSLASAEQQSSETALISAASTEMVDTIKEIAESATTAAHLA